MEAHINERALSAIGAVLYRLGLEEHPNYIAVEPDGAGGVRVRVSLPDHYITISLARDEEDFAGICYHQLCKELGYVTFKSVDPGADRE